MESVCKGAILFTSVFDSMTTCSGGMYLMTHIVIHVLEYKTHYMLINLMNEGNEVVAIIVSCRLMSS